MWLLLGWKLYMLCLVDWLLAGEYALDCWAWPMLALVAVRSVAGCRLRQPIWRATRQIGCSMLPFELHICLLLFKVNSDNEVFRKDVWNLFRAIQINRERVKSKNSLWQPICRSNYWLPAAATQQADRLLSVCILIPISSITVQSELRLWGVQKRCSESLHSNLEQWKSNYVEKAFYGNRSAG